MTFKMRLTKINLFAQIWKITWGLFIGHEVSLIIFESNVLVQCKEISHIYLLFALLSLLTWCEGSFNLNTSHSDGNFLTMFDYYDVPGYSPWLQREFPVIFTFKNVNKSFNIFGIGNCEIDKITYKICKYSLKTVIRLHMYMYSPYKSNFEIKCTFLGKYLNQPLLSTCTHP
jgi:hypothetical protein